MTPNLVNRIDDLSQPWTRSPTKSKMEHVLATWHFISSDPLLSGGICCWDSLQLAPMPESYDLDRGLLLAVQAIQALLENKGLLVIVGIGCKIAAKISSSSHAQKLAIAVQTQGRRRKRYTLFSVFVLLETLLLFQVVILPYAF